MESVIKIGVRKLYSVGDKIVYPLYGAGVIEDLEHHDIDGTSQIYYVMFIPTGNLKIKVSARKAANIGIREVYEKDKVIGLMEKIMEEPIEMPENWNLRYKENLEKIKSGNLLEVMLVFRNLLYRERERGLSSAEKKMLSTAKQIIVSEVILTQDINRDEAEELLTKYVG